MARQPTWTPPPPAESRIFWLAKDRRLFARRPAAPTGAWSIEDRGRVVFEGSPAECVRWLAAMPLPADAARATAAG